MVGKVNVDGRRLQVVRSLLRPVVEDLRGTDFVTDWQGAPDEALLGQIPRLPVIGPTVRPPFWGSSRGS